MKIIVYNTKDRVEEKSIIDKIREEYVDEIIYNINLLNKVDELNKMLQYKKNYRLSKEISGIAEDFNTSYLAETLSYIDAKRNLNINCVFLLKIDNDNTIETIKEKYSDIALYFI